MKMNPHWRSMLFTIICAVLALGIGAHSSWKERHPNLVFDPPVPSADGSPPVIRVHPPLPAQSSAPVSIDTGRDTQFALAQKAAAQREAAKQANDAAHARELQNYVDEYMAELLRHPERIQSPPDQPPVIAAIRSTK